jgi:hypothetical protein
VGGGNAEKPARHNEEEAGGGRWSDVAVVAVAVRRDRFGSPLDPVGEFWGDRLVLRSAKKYGWRADQGPCVPLVLKRVCTLTRLRSLSLSFGASQQRLANQPGPSYARLLTCIGLRARAYRDRP